MGSGCATGKDEKNAPKPVETEAAVPSLPAAELFETHRGWLPPDTVAVAVADPELLLQFVRGTYPKGEAGDQHYEAMLADFNELFVSRLGFSPTDAEAVFVGAGQRWQVVVFQGDLAHKLDQNESHEANGLTAYKVTMEGELMRPPLDQLWAVPLGEPQGLALFPTKQAFLAASAARAGQAEGLGEGAKLDAFTRLFQESEAGRIAVAAHLSPQLQQMANVQLPFPAPEAAIVSLSDDLRMKVMGEKRSLDGIQTLVEQRRRAANQMIEQQYAQRKTAEIGLAATFIMSYHILRSYNEVFESERTDGEYAVQIALPRDKMNMMFVGVGAAIAIPAFLKYIERSKASEASLVLQQIANEAQAYYVQSGDDGTCEFPPTAGPSPAAKSCCEFNDGQGGGKCPATAEWWDEPGWKAIDFQMNDPHYFAYEMVNREDEMGRDLLILRASTDFTCGGPRHTVEISIVGTQDEDGNCRVEARPAITSNEFE